MLIKSLTIKWNWLIFIYVLFGYGLNNIMSLWFIPYVNIKYNIDSSIASLIVNIGFRVTSAISSAILGIIIAQKGFNHRRLILYIGTIMVSIIFILIYLWNNKNTSIFAIIIVVIIFGSGSERVRLLLNFIVEYNVYYHTESIVTGLYFTSLYIIQFVLQTLVGILIDISAKNNGKNKNGEQIYKVIDYNLGFLVYVFCTLISLIFIHWFKETYGHIVDYDEHGNMIIHKQEVKYDSQNSNINKQEQQGIDSDYKQIQDTLNLIETGVKNYKSNN